MAEQTLREFAQQQLECAQKIIRSGKELMPVLVIETDGAPIIAGFPEYGHGSKTLQREVMKDLLREKNAERYCFVMEAWFGSPPDGKFDQHYRPMNDPKRMEAIAVSAQASDGEKVFLVCQIKRGKGGLVQFDEKKPDLGSPVGPLGDLFDKDTRQ